MQEPNSLLKSVSEILEKCEETSIDIGSLSGHFITSEQIAVIKHILSVEIARGDFEGVSIKGKNRVDPQTSITTEENQLRAELNSLKKSINKKSDELTKANKPQRQRLNEELGLLLSRRARIYKALTKFE